MALGFCAIPNAMPSVTPFVASAEKITSAISRDAESSCGRALDRSAPPSAWPAAGPVVAGARTPPAAADSERLPCDVAEGRWGFGSGEKR